MPGEAKTICRYHAGLEVSVMMGGTNADKERRQVGAGGPGPQTILVATPGRLEDHRPGRPGRLSGRSVSHSKLVLYGGFVWACRALSRPKRWFPARAVYNTEGFQARFGGALPCRRSTKVPYYMCSHTTPIQTCI